MQVQRVEVLPIVDALLSEEMTREEASRWAAPRHLVEQHDPVVEEALDLLVATDSLQIDNEGRSLGYLFDFADLKALRSALAEQP
jgi:hypothetical protein